MQPEIEIELRKPAAGTKEVVAFYFDTTIRLGERKITIYGGVIFNGKDGGYNPHLPSKPGKKDGKSFPIVMLDRELWEAVINKAKAVASARKAA